MTSNLLYDEIISTVFLEASDACHPETMTIPFTWDHLHAVAGYPRIMKARKSKTSKTKTGTKPKNTPDCLYHFRHFRDDLPKLITDTLPPGHTISILNERISAAMPRTRGGSRHSKKAQPYFQVHPAFEFEVINTAPEAILNDSHNLSIDEQKSLPFIDRHRLLDRLFCGEYRDVEFLQAHMKDGLYGEVDGVWTAIRSEDDQRVLICINAKTTKEKPSGLFIYHNTEIIADRKYPGWPVVHVFAYASKPHDLIDLYQIELNKQELSCKIIRGQSFHIIPRAH